MRQVSWNRGQVSGDSQVIPVTTTSPQSIIKMAYNTVTTVQPQAPELPEEAEGAVKELTLRELIERGRQHDYEEFVNSLPWHFSIDWAPHVRFNESIGLGVVDPPRPPNPLVIEDKDERQARLYGCRRSTQDCCINMIRDLRKVYPERPTIHKLNDAIMYKIFGLLDGNDWQKCEIVCRRWQSLVHSIYRMREKALFKLNIPIITEDVELPPIPTLTI